MPYPIKAHRLFEGIAHGSIPPRKGLSREKAGELASEGVKKSPHRMKTLIKRKK
jgi:hypothetical protein